MGGGPSVFCRSQCSVLLSGSGDASRDEFCDEGGDGKIALDDGLGVRDCSEVNGELETELMSSSELIVVMGSFRFINSGNMYPIASKCNESTHVCDYQCNYYLC